MKPKGLATSLASFLAMGMTLPAVTSAASPGTPSLTALASQAGILPTSPLYPLKRLVESIELWVTFSPQGKVQLLSYLATVRAAEAAALLTRHETADVSQALAQYTQDLQKAGALLPTLVSKKSDTNLKPLIASLASAAEDGQSVAAHGVLGHAGQVAQKVSQMALAETTIAGPLTATGTASSQTTGSASSTATPSLLSSGNDGGVNLLASAVAQASNTPLSDVIALYDKSHSWNQVAKSLHASLGSVLSALAGQLSAIEVSASSGQATTSSSSTTPPSDTSSTSPSSSSSSTSSTSSSSSSSSSTPPSSSSSSSDTSGTVNSKGSSHSAEAKGKESKHSESKSPESQSPESQSPEKPESEGSVVGTVSAISASSITVDQKSYPLSTGVAVTYHDWVLSPSSVSAGFAVKLSIKGGSVTHIKILKDPNLPPGDSVSGTISRIDSQNVSIGGYTLPVDSSVKVGYHDYNLTLSQVPSGVEAVVHLDSHGTVVKITLKTDPNLPPGDTVEGSVGSMASGQITVGSYTLPLSAGVVPIWKDQPYTGSLQPGWTVRVKLDSQGQVVKIKILNGPTTTSSAPSSSESSPSSSVSSPSSSQSAPSSSG